MWVELSKKVRSTISHRMSPTIASMMIAAAATARTETDQTARSGQLSGRST